MFPSLLFMACSFDCFLEKMRGLACWIDSRLCILNAFCHPFACVLSLLDPVPVPKSFGNCKKLRMHSESGENWNVITMALIAKRRTIRTQMELLR